MTVDQWEQPITTVARSLRAAADHLDKIAKDGDVSFVDLSRIQAMLSSSLAIIRLIPDSLGDLRNYLKERNAQ